MHLPRRQTTTAARTAVHTVARSTALASVAVLFAASTLPAQWAPPAWQMQRFVAATDDIRALWVNPAGIGVRELGSALLSYDAGADLPERQLMAGARLGPLGIGYQHDDFDPTEPGDGFRGDGRLRGSGFANGDAYSVGGALRLGAVHLGGAVTLHRVGDERTGWDAGVLWRPSRWASLGAAWRDIGSTVVRGIELDSRIVGGLSIRPGTERLTLSTEAEWNVDEGGTDEWGVGARGSVVRGIELFGALRTPLDAGDARLAAGVTWVLPRADLVAGAREPRFDGTAYTGQVLLRGGVRPDALRAGAAVRTVTLAGPYVDWAPRGFALFGGGLDGAQPVIAAIRNARGDPGTAGLLVRVRGLGEAFVGQVSAVHQELREAIVDFRGSGKPVVAYLEGGAGAPELYVASAADRVVIPPLASVVDLGVELEIHRLAGLFEKIYVDWDVFAAGEYKTSFQPVVDSATAAQREAIESLVEIAYGELVATLADGRGLAVDSVRDLADGGLRSAVWARRAGLVDSLGWYEDAEELAEALAGEDVGRPLDDPPEWPLRWRPAPEVALIYARGPITAGESRRDPISGEVVIGGRTVARLIRSAGADPRVRAVVFRIDSPGGSVIGSELVRRALRDVRTEHEKPVVVSMSDIAASGGYWIAVAADAIVADPLTVTGSIGVIAAVPDVTGLLDSLDVGRELYRRGENTGVFDITLERTPDQIRQITGRNRELYDAFVERVAAGRPLSVDSVRSIARGRVWLGEQARTIGLVDALGTLTDAVHIAASLADLESGEYAVALRRRSADGFFPRGILRGLRGILRSGLH